MAAHAVPPLPPPSNTVAGCVRHLQGLVDPECPPDAQAFVFAIYDERSKMQVGGCACRDAASCSAARPVTTCTLPCPPICKHMHPPPCWSPSWPSLQYVGFSKDLRNSLRTLLTRRPEKSYTYKCVTPPPPPRACACCDAQPSTRRCPCSSQAAAAGPNLLHPPAATAAHPMMRRLPAG